MLSLVLAQIYDLPEPAHIRDDSIVGHPKNPPKFGQIPQIAITHSQPHYLMRFPAINELLKTPKCIFVVRNPKDLLVATYEKAKGEYLDKKYQKQNVTFSEYLRNDISKRYRMEDLWGFIRFFNAWGAVNAASPKTTLLIKYEDLLNDPLEGLKRICAFVGIDASNEILEHAVNKSSKQEMRQKLDKSEAKFEKTVNLDQRNANDWFNESDETFFRQICARYLKYDFGYLEQVK